MPARLGTPDPNSLYSSPIPMTRATLDDKVALLASTATAVTNQIAGPAGGAGVTQNFGGTEVTSKAAGKRGLARSITITTTASAAAYKTGAGSPIVVTGTRAGNVVSENILLTAAGGGETVRGTLLYDDPTQCTVAIPGQNNTAGAISIGCGDVGTYDGGQLRGIKALGAAATVVVQGQDGRFDSLTLPSQVLEWVSCARLCAVGGGDTTSAVGFTVYP